MPRDFETERLAKKTLKLFTHKECKQHRMKGVKLKLIIPNRYYLVLSYATYPAVILFVRMEGWMFDTLSCLNG